MTSLERICEAYWNAFRDGFLRVGGKGYPLWNQGHPEVKAETMRCMRHAMETLKGNEIDPDMFDAIFPDLPTKRGQPITPQDEMMAEKVKP